jgi:hypothetical protein
MQENLSRLMRTMFLRQTMEWLKETVCAPVLPGRGHRYQKADYEIDNSETSGTRHSNFFGLLRIRH